MKTIAIKTEKGESFRLPVISFDFQKLEVVIRPNEPKCFISDIDGFDLEGVIESPKEYGGHKCFIAPHKYMMNNGKFIVNII